MALKLATAATRRVAYGFDPDIKRNVYLIVRSISPEERADFTRELMTTRRRQQLANMPADKFNEHLRKAAERQAAAVLADSVDFTLCLDAKLAAEFQAQTGFLPGDGVQVGENWEIKLDGRWGADGVGDQTALKKWMFRYVPRIVDVVVPESNKVGDLEEADDQEEVTAFRR